MRQILLTAILLIAGSGCTYNDVGCTGNANLFETAVTLKIAIGEKVCNPQSGLAVRFERVVSDSRCPEGANCFWAGRVSVQLTVLKNDNTVGTLNISRDEPVVKFTIPEFKVQRDYLFTLKDVDPYPVIGKVTPSHKYSLDIEIAPEEE